jgi:hypothetical protein
MNRKGFEWKLLCDLIEILSSICLGGTAETHENPQPTEICAERRPNTILQNLPLDDPARLLMFRIPPRLCVLSQDVVADVTTEESRFHPRREQRFF